MRILGKAGKMGEIESRKRRRAGKDRRTGKDGRAGKDRSVGKVCKAGNEGKEGGSMRGGGHYRRHVAVAPAAAYGAQPWSLENGQYVDASGAPIAGALEKASP